MKIIPDTPELLSASDIEELARKKELEDNDLIKMVNKIWEIPHVGALLDYRYDSSKWISLGDGDVRGGWAEDGSPYTIQAPSETMATILLEVRNILSKAWEEKEKREYDT